jgi:hypothetical protein
LDITLKEDIVISKKKNPKEKSYQSPLLSEYLSILGRTKKYPKRKKKKQNLPSKSSSLEPPIQDNIHGQG